MCTIYKKVLIQIVKQVSFLKFMFITRGTNIFILPIVCATYENVQSCRIFLLFFIQFSKQMEFLKKPFFLRNKLICLEVALFKNDHY